MQVSQNGAPKTLKCYSLSIGTPEKVPLTLGNPPYLHLEEHLTPHTLNLKASELALRLRTRSAGEQADVHLCLEGGLGFRV